MLFCLVSKPFECIDKTRGDKVGKLESHLNTRMSRLGVLCVRDVCRTRRQLNGNFWALGALNKNWTSPLGVE